MAENKLQILQPADVDQSVLLDEVEQFLVLNQVDEIKTVEDCERAAMVLREIQTRSKAIEEKRFKFTRPLDDLKTEWMRFFEPMKAKYKMAREAIEARVREWDAEQKRIEQEEQEKLRKLQLELVKKEQEDVKAEIESLEEVGDLEGVELARQKLTAGTYIAPPAIAREKPKMAGVSRPKSVKWRIIDQSKIPDKWLMTVVDEEQINGYVRSHGMSAKKEAAEWGIEIYEEEGFSVRRNK